VKGAARLVLLLGAAALGAFLLRSAPHDVTLVYPLPDPGGVTGVEVEVRRGEETLRRAELRFPGGAPEAVRHPVRLPDGEYAVRLLVTRRDAPPRRLAARFRVEEEGPIVLPLSDAP
jgi:hypothetical protein